MIKSLEMKQDEAFWYFLLLFTIYDTVYIIRKLLFIIGTRFNSETIIVHNAL